MTSARGLLLAAGLLALSASAGQAQSDASPVKIGVLTDMSGPYADIAGAGSVEAARLAIQDAGGTVAGHPVQVLIGDHLDKPDVGADIARKWYDVDKVDVIVDI